MKKLLFFGLLMMLVTPIFAQKYTTAIGARLGVPFGITMQQRVWSDVTVEGVLYTNFTKRSGLIALLEHHQEVVFQRRLNIYYGGGVHLGVEREVDKNPKGLAFVLGAEVTLADFNVSYDFMPVVNLSGGSKIFMGQSALSVRYVIIAEPKLDFLDKKKRQKNKSKRQKQKAKEKARNN